MPTLAEVASTTARRSGRLLIALAAIPAIAGAALLLARALQPSTTTTGQPLSNDPAPPAIFARQICSFSNDDARAALVQGGDGGQSIVVGGRTWWLFGDTLYLAKSGKQIGANSIAWSDTRNAAGCPELHYNAQDGLAAPFLPKDGSLTAWPSGAWPSSDHSFDFYTAYVYGSGPYAYWIGEVGLARFDTNTMQTTILARKLWEGQRSAGNQVIGAMPIEVTAGDGLLRLALQTKAPGTNESTAVHEVLARVAPAAMADVTAYEYWDGAAWTPSLDTAQPLWDVPNPTDPVQKLAAFENGASITWNEGLHKYVALMNTSFSAIGARTADRLEGPWSDAEPWLDCHTFAQVRIPTCYSPFQQAGFGDASGSIFTTVSSLEPYATAAFELRPAVAIREWRGAKNATAYAAASPGSGWSDQGIAFYASATPLDGFSAVYRWQRGDESQYAAASPGDGFERGDAAFHAPGTATVAGSSVTYEPVFAWQNGASHLLSPKSGGLEQYGYTRGAPAFYAPRVGNRVD